MFDRGTYDFLKPPTVMNTSGLPVLQAVRDGGDGPLIEVRMAGDAAPDATVQIFSGRRQARSDLPIPANKENGEIPAGSWYITSNGKQRPPKDILRELTSQRVLELPDGERYRAMSGKKMWLSLYRDDRSAWLYNSIDDFTVEGFSLRDGIRLHFGEGSNGCFTFRNPQGYAKILRALSKAKPKYFDPAGNPVSAGTPNAIKVYGKLEIPHKVVP